MTSKYEKIEELMNKYRMGMHTNDQTEQNMRVNRLYGLRDLISNHLNENSIVCEVGSFQGASSELFALTCKMVYCVDIFNYPVDLPESYEVTFDKMAARYSNIIKIVGESTEVAKQFPDHFFDFVYLDASHDYESARADILAWKNKVKLNGFIGGHDYLVNKFGVGVPQAIGEIFTGDIMVYEDSSWIKRMEQ
jgi:hypothetical protein